MNSFFRLLLLGFGLAASAALAHAQDSKIIAHPGVAESSLAADDWSNILLGKKTSWGSGSIKLALLTEGPVHETVVKNATQRTADQLDKHWKKLVFTGKGIMPTQVKTDDEMVAYVAKTPGAVGYIGTGSAAEGVKVLSLQ